MAKVKKKNVFNFSRYSRHTSSCLSPVKRWTICLCNTITCTFLGNSGDMIVTIGGNGCPEIDLSHSPYYVIYHRKTINLDSKILWQYNFGNLKTVFVATKPLESPFANEFKI